MFSQKKRQIAKSCIAAAVMFGVLGAVNASTEEEKLKELERAMNAPSEPGMAKPKARTRAIVFDNQPAGMEAPAPVAAAPMAARDCFGLPPDVRSTGVDFPIQFNVGSAVISPASESTLNLIAKSLALNERCIIVEGHTDASGNYDRNLMLSRERAESVINFLTSRSGIDRKRLVPVGKGSSDPLRSLDARDPKNRRVVFKVVTG